MFLTLLVCLWINALGDRSFKTRMLASKRLEVLSQEQDIRRFLQAATHNPDPEIRLRAGLILNEFTCLHLCVDEVPPIWFFATRISPAQGDATLERLAKKHEIMLKNGSEGWVFVGDLKSTILKDEKAQNVALEYLSEILLEGVSRKEALARLDRTRIKWQEYYCTTRATYP